MAKITFGKQSGDSRFNMDVVTSSDSKTTITAGDQEDHSVREVRVVDLPPNINLSHLANDLSALLAAMNPQQAATHSAAIENLSLAEKAARSGDRPGAKAFLAKAGTWAFDLANKAGTDVAAAALKHVLGM